MRDACAPPKLLGPLGTYDAAKLSVTEGGVGPQNKMSAEEKTAARAQTRDEKEETAEQQPKPNVKIMKWR